MGDSYSVDRNRSVPLLSYRGLVYSYPYGQIVVPSIRWGTKCLRHLKKGTSYGACSYNACTRMHPLKASSYPPARWLPVGEAGAKEKNPPVAPVSVGLDGGVGPGGSGHGNYQGRRPRLERARDQWSCPNDAPMMPQWPCLITTWGPCWT